MPTAVIAGGSVAGLASALALSGIGYCVMVLERAPKPPQWSTADATSGWKRPTVPQGLQSHTLTSLGVRVLRERAPQVLAGAEAAGAPVLDLTQALPAEATGSAREPGDSELVALGCRRSSLEILLHRTVRNLADVTIRYDTTVAGLELDTVHHRKVKAVVTGAGERIRADIVVDATGRRALSRRWLRDAGVPLATDRTSPSGLAGHTRFYRLKTGSLPGPLNRGHGVGDVFGHYAGVLHPGDNGTFSIALGCLPGDQALQGLRTRPGFTAAARATPGLAPWLEDGVSSPISPVRVISSPPNALWGAAGQQQCPVPGLFQVGDAACITNPLFGRGISLALDHAFRLADLLAEQPDIDIAQRRAVARMTHELFLPWYEQSVGSDQLRIARWRAAVDGAPAPAVPVPPGDLPTTEEIVNAARSDGTVWRGLMRMLMTLSTASELFGDDKFLALVRQAAPAGPAPSSPVSRDELVRRVTAAEGTRT